MLAILYISSAVQPFSEAALSALVARSREKNGRLEITGILLYADGNVMQLIEGPDQTVRSLEETIFRDSRHYGVIQLVERAISEQEFPDWSMEFQDLSRNKLQRLADFIDDEESLHEAKIKHGAASLKREAQNENQVLQESDVNYARSATTESFIVRGRFGLRYL
jgi:acylphosphatase